MPQCPNCKDGIHDECLFEDDEGNTCTCECLDVLDDDDDPESFIPQTPSKS